jgi:hypothetical protein
LAAKIEMKMALVAKPPAAKRAFMLFFMRISLRWPAIDMARCSCPRECFERCDTVRNGLIPLN